MLAGFWRQFSSWTRLYGTAVRLAQLQCQRVDVGPIQSEFFCAPAVGCEQDCLARRFCRYWVLRSCIGATVQCAKMFSALPNETRWWVLPTNLVLLEMNWSVNKKLFLIFIANQHWKHQIISKFPSYTKVVVCNMQITHLPNYYICG